MKFWLKSGVIGGISLSGLHFLLILSLLIGTIVSISAPNFWFSANFFNIYLPGSNELFSKFLISTISTSIILFIFGFFIGVSIGWIVEKMKVKK